MIRSFALFLAVLTLLNLAGSLFLQGFDVSNWWISFGVLPAWIARIFLAGFALLMFDFALRPFRATAADRDVRSHLTAATAATFALLSLAEAAGYYRALAKGQISTTVPVPFALVISVGLFMVAWRAWSGESSPPQGLRRVLVGALVLLGLFPLGLMVFLGNTDYRRPADLAVVLGARVYADGRMSDALEDRIRTGCELYRSGLAKRLMLSGGAGDGPLTEASVMRLYALAHGVRVQDIFVDDKGRNTWATVQDTVPLFRRWGARRILVVSHFYHLPRIKLAYQRAGFNVWTVPARQNRILLKLPLNMVREVVAFWAYYLGKVRDKPI